ncbi:MAG TPA: NUDIX domain-containing protein [Myxococcota bacterium]|nr:NUDIX domain-containing protein [Myxococcota bacterium]
MAVTVDVAVLTLHERRLHVLLIERGREPWLGAWALPGGFVRVDETLEEAAARELREETGIDASAHLEQIGAYGDPGRDPRMRVVTVAYLAVLPRIGPLHAGSDAARAELVPVEEALGAERPLAFDHETILADAVARMRDELATTSLATAFVGPEFTISDLREVYEAAWGVPLDSGNFRRKVLATANFVTPTGRYAAPGPDGGKPAEIYRRVGRARLHPPLQPTAAALADVAPPPKDAQRATSDRDSDRVAVWRAWAGDDRALARHFLDAGVLAPVARGDALISDEEWRAFTAGIQAGDLVVLELPGGRAAIGEVRSAAVDRPRARDRRLQQVREVAWLAELAQSDLPDDVRTRLSAPGVLTPIRVTGAARRLRRLVDQHGG